MRERDERWPAEGEKRLGLGWGGGDGRRRALYSPPPQRSDRPPTGRSNGRGGRGAGPDGPPSCQMGRGRASPCWALSRAGPVLVPRAEIAAQARPGLWHGHGTGLRGNRPGRVSAVLYRTGPVPARWARPIWLDGGPSGPAPRAPLDRWICPLGGDLTVGGRDI